MVKVAGFCVSALALLAGCSSSHSSDKSAEKIVLTMRPAVEAGPHGQPCVISGPNPGMRSVVATIVKINMKPGSLQSAPVSIAVTGSGKLTVIADPPPDGWYWEGGVTNADPPGTTHGGGTGTKPPSSQPASSQPTIGGPSSCSTIR